MLRIGLLGASKIAVPAIFDVAAQMPDVTVTAVAARDPEAARAYAKQHGIAHVARDYATLIARDDVDLVYNGLPPSAHAPWSIAALQSDKAVLCEKPFCMNAEQAAEMVRVAELCGRPLIEAFHYRFHPVFEQALALLQGGAIGDVQRMQAHFNIGIRDAPGELRYAPELGGGALMDLGCYPLHWTRVVAGCEPEVQRASAKWHVTDVDTAMVASLQFPNGVHADIACDMSRDLPHVVDAALVVFGSSGELRLENPLAPHNGYSLTLRRGVDVQDIAVAGDRRSTYWCQLQHVKAVLDGTQRQYTGGADAINTMRAIDAIYAQARD